MKHRYYFDGSFKDFCKSCNLTNKCKVNILFIDNNYVKFQINEDEGTLFHLFYLAIR